MNVKKNQVALLLGVLGILAGYLCWNFGYKKFNEQADQAASQAAQIEAKIAEYESLEQNKDFYVSETGRYERDITEILNNFPSYQLPEDTIKLVYENAVYTLDNYLFVNNMAFTEPTALYTADYSGIDTSYAPASSVIDTSNPYPTYVLYDLGTTLGLTASYNGLKDVLNLIYRQTDRKAISSIVLGYDSSTGLLSGNVGVENYFVTGSDKGYSQPVLTPVQTGTENPFGVLKVEETEAPAEEAAAAE